MANNKRKNTKCTENEHDFKCVLVICRKIINILDYDSRGNEFYVGCQSLTF